MIKIDTSRSNGGVPNRGGETGGGRRRYEAPVVKPFGRKLPAFAPPSEPRAPGMPPPPRG